MKITRIRITDYRGIEHLDVDVPPAGAIVTGRNGQGKTSVLKAIGAALAANGIGPDAIRLGADAAEVLVNLDDLTVRRAIRQRSSSVTVTPEGEEPWTRPQTRLTELLGTAALDPLGFFLADPKERKRLVLEAAPLKVTAEDAKKWLGSDVPVKLPEGHGLEVLAALRKDFYDQRAEANKTAKDALAKAARAVPTAEQLAAVAGALPVDEAQRQLDAASRALDELSGRRWAAERAQQQTAGVRERIAELRSRAVAEVDPSPSTETFLAAGGDHAVALEALAAARREVTRLEAEAESLSMRVAHLHQQRQQADRELAERRALARQADELEASIASASANVTDEEIESASAARKAAEAARNLALDAKIIREQRERAEQLALDARKAEKLADRLDDIVETLTKRAPAELARRSEMIPGLEFRGDEITLDGVALDSLSGAEQMRFAISLARRLNAKAKILVVDGLERLDGVRGVEFVELATADGWQLIATRVKDGELVAEAIEV